MVDKFTCSELCPCPESVLLNKNVPTPSYYFLTYPHIEKFRINLDDLSDTQLTEYESQGYNATIVPLIFRNEGVTFNSFYECKTQKLDKIWGDPREGIYALLKLPR